MATERPPVHAMDIWINCCEPLEDLQHSAGLIPFDVDFDFGSVFSQLVIVDLWERWPEATDEEIKEAIVRAFAEIAHG
jgi:hypothetical protein